jgi:hypothetical protein
MSLDVYLRMPGTEVLGIAKIMIRENGETKEISREEWDRRFPDREPFMVEPMPRDEGEVYSANITHNLGKMAREAGIYEHCWRPEELGIKTAGQLIEPLRAGIAAMRADPPRFEKLNASNGWGLYENFLPWLERYLEACEEFPQAEVSVSR